MMWERDYTDPTLYDVERLFDEIHRRLLAIAEPAAREIDRMLEDVQQKINSLGAEVHDAEDKYIIIFELPGFEKEDIKVTAGQNYIEIRARRKAREVEGTRIGERKIERRIRFPEEIDPDAVRARFKNGVLEIIAPKAHPAKTRTVKIE